MSMTNTRAEVTTVALPAGRARFRPQLSLRFLIFLVTIAAGVLSLILTPGSINIRLGAVCCLTAGAVYGASVLRNVRGIGPLRGRAFGGAWGGAVTGLFVMFVLQIAGPWQPSLYSFEFQMYWWFSVGAIYGTVVGCLTALLRFRCVWPRESTCDVTVLGATIRDNTPPLPGRLTAGPRGWLRNRFEEIPAIYAATFIHVAFATSIGAMTLVAHSLPMDGNRSQPIVIVAAERSADEGHQAGQDSTAEFTARTKSQNFALEAAHPDRSNSAWTSVIAAAPEVGLQPPKEVVRQFLEAIKQGDGETHRRLLTQSGREEAPKRFPATWSPRATFQYGVGEARIETTDLAIVDAQHSDLHIGEERVTIKVRYLLRREYAGWRIARKLQFVTGGPMPYNYENRDVRGQQEEVRLRQLLEKNPPSWESHAPSPAPNTKWGTMRGRFVYDGPWPGRQPVNITKDNDAFPETIFDESLVVNKQNGGIANVVIWLRTPPGKEPPPVPPDFAQSNTKEHVMIIKDGRFQPHVLAMSTSQKLIIRNQDSVPFNPHINFRANPQIAAAIPAGPEQEITVQKRERLPARVECAVHPWMKAYVLVQDHPYFAVTDANGNFEIRNLPRGERTFQIWHEQIGYITSVNRSGKTENWPGGRPAISIDAAEVDLGEILVPPAAFK